MTIICDICGKILTSNLKRHQANIHDIGVNWTYCDIEGCDYKAKQTSNLNEHKARIHDIGIKWYYCDIEGCDYKAKGAGHLKRHQADIHDIGVNWTYCDIEGCDYKAKQTSSLNIHKACIHDIGIKWYYCDIEGCNYKAKGAGHLKPHQANIHDIGVNWFHCNIECCDYKAKGAAHLKPHQAHVHDIGVKWYYCDIEGCDHKAKEAAYLRQHQSFVHDIGVKWYYCDIEGCNYKAKQTGCLKQHQTNVHNIGVQWKYCDIEGCNHKAKQASALKRHKEQIHDIGKYTCDYCFKNRNSHISYKDNNTPKPAKICRGCFRKATGYESRAEKQMSDYLDKNVGTEFLLGSDKSLKSMGGCSLKRPDKLYASPGRVEMDECDEHEHRYSNGDYNCDEERITEIYDEFVGEKCIVIRWNPDNYKIPDNRKKSTKKLDRKERLELLVELKTRLRLSDIPAEPIFCFFMFYSEDSERLTKNIPYYLIYDQSDIDKFFVEYK